MAGGTGETFKNKESDETVEDFLFYDFAENSYSERKPLNGNGLSWKIANRDKKRFESVKVRCRECLNL